MDDKELNLVEMGEMLRQQRGARSRRELAERTGLSASHLQKVEEGRSLDITLSTLGSLAEGYEVSPIYLLKMAMSLKTTDVVDWATGDEEVQRALERVLGRRVVVEADLSADVLARLEALGTQVARLEALGTHVERMGSLIVALSSFVIALQTTLESHLGSPVARGEVGEDIGDLVRSLRSQD